MSVIKTNLSVSPAFIGTCRYVSQGNKLVYGGSFKDFLKIAWSVIKPGIRAVLTNPNVRKAAAQGADQIAELLKDVNEIKETHQKKKESLDNSRGDLRGDILNYKKKGKGLSRQGRNKLEMMLGNGIKYLY